MNAWVHGHSHSYILYVLEFKVYAVRRPARLHSSSLRDIKIIDKIWVTGAIMGKRVITY